MSASVRQPSDGLPRGPVACLLIDGAGTVVGWSRDATDLLGWEADNVCGQPLRDLLAKEGQEIRTDAPTADRIDLQHRSGSAVEVLCKALPVEGATTMLVLMTQLADSAEEQEADTLLRTLLFGGKKINGRRRHLICTRAPPPGTAPPPDGDGDGSGPAGTGASAFPAPSGPASTSTTVSRETTNRSQSSSASRNSASTRSASSRRASTR
ncbi:PAS domain-containing protein [Streptomyces sp. NPDC056512]|uniref:PAS domain-containing protein n=1 Tax=Streptomyces sp. NPDC056512 TaxID=3345846 RepID=UPI00367B7CFD